MTLLERDPLLAELTGRLVDARRGRGSFVLVSGEAGIGKTALVDAFVRGVPRATRVLRGSCDPVVPPRPFAPLGDMAARTPDGLRAALDAADRDRVFDRFLRLIRDQGSGAVVIFEDLHWADSATLDLLRVVGRRLPETPILVGRNIPGPRRGRRAPASFADPINGRLACAVTNQDWSSSSRT
jgi:predicted ATPase